MNRLVIASMFLFYAASHTTPFLDLNANIPQQLEAHHLWSPNNPLRLHLGCGEWHLDGYVNIDFPLTEHTVQTSSGADICGDISQLRMPRESVDEIRNHHVFEHFDRQEALALLCNWHQALKVGGTLYIETPDFEESIKLLLFNASLTYQDKQGIMRHIFGSHEAHWAIHCDGWYREKFIHVLTMLDFEIVSIEYSGWLNIRNIHVVARKKCHRSRAFLVTACKEILLESKVVEGEVKMWQTWCDQLEKLVF
jgi:SAM-dependent methyltransferase